VDGLRRSTDRRCRGLPRLVHVAGPRLVDRKVRSAAGRGCVGCEGWIRHPVGSGARWLPPASRRRRRLWNRNRTD